MVSFVYFDVGGVLVKDFSGNDKWIKLLHDLGVQEKDYEKMVNFYDKHNDEFCSGRDVDTFIPEIAEKFGLKIPAEYSLNQDFVDRFEVNKDIWPIVTFLKEKCRIGLLTNMYPGMLQLIENRKLLPKVEWDVTIDSSIEKVCKPYKEIYEIAERESGVDKKEILFIENTQKNVKAAEDFGWQTYFYDSSRYVESAKNLELFIKDLFK